jgi:hypothetical protein
MLLNPSLTFVYCKFVRIAPKWKRGMEPTSANATSAMSLMMSMQQQQQQQQLQQHSFNAAHLGRNNVASPGTATALNAQAIVDAAAAAALAAGSNPYQQLQQQSHRRAAAAVNEDMLWMPAHRPMVGGGAAAAFEALRHDFYVSQREEKRQQEAMAAAAAANRQHSGETSRSPDYNSSASTSNTAQLPSGAGAMLGSGLNPRQYVTQSFRLYVLARHSTCGIVCVSL